MNSGKYVFAQLLHFINRYEFEKFVSKYNGDFRIREFNCWNQFVQLFFGQLTSRNSLRDICTCLKAHKNKLYHLGISSCVNQSTLSRANGSIRVDVPETNSQPSFSKILNNGAIYAITPVDEQLSRMQAESIAARPLESYELSRMLDKKLKNDGLMLTYQENGDTVMSKARHDDDAHLAF